VKTDKELLKIFDMEKIIRSLSAHEAERLLEYLSGSRTLEEVGQWLAARQG
jgi:hypothetical protein